MYATTNGAKGAASHQVPVGGIHGLRTQIVGRRIMLGATAPAVAAGAMTKPELLSLD